MDLVAIGNYIKDIEEKHVDSIMGLRFLGFNVWRIYRNVICARMYSKNFQQTVQNKKQAVFYDLRKVAKTFRSSKNRVFIRTTTHLYNSFKDGIWYSNRTAVLKESTGDDAFIFSQVGTDKDKERKKGKLFPQVDLPSNFIRFYAGILKYLLFPVIIPIAICHLMILRRFENFSFKEIAGLLSVFVAEIGLYYCYYAFAKPREVIFLFASYGCEGEIAALKKLNVRILEYQHGNIYPEHFGYNINRVLKKIKGELLLPDKFMTYGEYWRQILLKSDFWDEADIITVGHSEFIDVEEVTIDTKGRIPVLVSSQPGYGSLLREFITNYLEKSLYKDDYYWIIRLHPRENDSEWYDFTDKNDLVEVSHSTTYSLLKFVDVHLVGSSFSLFEALYFGVTNYILSNDLLEVCDSEMFNNRVGTVITAGYLDKFSRKAMVYGKDFFKPLNKEELLSVFSEESPWENTVEMVS